jgi:hypothetical protein
VIEVVDVSAVIQAIEPAKRTLTLKGPQGNVIPLKIDKSVKAFDQLKVGDSIHVRYTEAVAISVSKPCRKKVWEEKRIGVGELAHVL